MRRLSVPLRPSYLFRRRTDLRRGDLTGHYPVELAKNREQEQEQGQFTITQLNKMSSQWLVCEGS